MISPIPTAREAAAATRCLEATELECIREDRVLFSGLNLRVTPGEVLQVSGPNGSGKTSLLRILCGLGEADRGEVRWCGEPVRGQDAAFRRRLRYVGHQDGVKLDLSAAQNLAIAGALLTDPVRSVAEVLDRAGLAPYVAVPARRLSAGQRRRLALSRLLLADAAIWILDEPLTALDAGGRAFVHELVAAHAAGGGVAVVAGHQLLDLPGTAARTLALGT